MADLTDALFPEPAAPQTWRQRLDLDGIEAQYGLPPGLLTSVLRVESGGNPTARSRAGAQGLFQLMPATARSYNVSPYDPLDAAHAAGQELRTLYKKYDGDMPSTLAAWNWGQGNLDKHGLAKAPQETRGFIQSVLGAASPRTAAAAGRDITSELESGRRGRDVTDELFGTSGAMPEPGAGSDIAPPSPPSLPPVRPVVPQQAPTPAAQPWQPSTMPSDLTIPIPPTSDTPAAVTPSRPQIPLPGISFEGNALDDRSSAAQQGPGAPGTLGQAALATGRQGAAMGINALGGIAGGAAGALATPVLGPAGVPLGTAAGSFGARKLNTALGLEEPGLLGDVLSVGVPLLPLAYQGGKALVAATRAGRALSKAEQETASQALDYLTTYRQQEAKNLEQAVAARAQGNEAQQAWLGAREAEKLKFAEDVTRASGEHGQALARWQRAQDVKLARHAERVAQAQQQAEQATAAADAAYQAKGSQAYDTALGQAKQAQANYRNALAEYKTATDAHQQAVQQVQRLPGQYLPKAPARSLDDVWNDQRILDRGGPETDALLKKMGVADVFEASARLADEGETLMQTAGGAGRFVPGEPIASTYQQPRLPGAKETRTELQTFIRHQGGIKLADEELHGEFAGLISRKETGTTGLVNNRTGKTAQQIAEAAQEQGYIATADKDSLLEALRESVTEGKPRFRLGEAGPQPAAPVPLPGQLPKTSTSGAAPAPPAFQVHGPGSASRVLYERLERIAGSSPVDLSSVGEAAASLKQELGYGVPSLQPTRVDRILNDLVTMGPEGSVKQVHEALKDIGPLTRHSNAKVRYASKGVIRELHNAMETAALDFPETEHAQKLLRSANQAWKQEEGVQALQDMLSKRGAGSILSRDDQGRYVLNVKALLNRTDNEDFLSWFPPAEQERLKADIASLIGTPPLPKQAPPLPGPVPVKELGAPPSPVEPKAIPPPAQTAPPRLRIPPRRVPETEMPEVVTQPYTPLPFEPPAPVEPSVTLPGPGRLLADIGAGSALRYATGIPGMQVAVPIADVAEALLSKALVSPMLRPLVRQALQPTGHLDPRLWGVLAAALKMPLTPEPSPRKERD
jgi:hypothetical protein